MSEIENLFGSAVKGYINGILIAIGILAVLGIIMLIVNLFD